MRNAIQTVRQRYQGQRRLRSKSIAHFGGIDAVKAHPVAAMRMRPDEGGTISTSLNMTLAPVNGYMRSNAYVHVQQIAVPYQAIEKLELDTQDDAGVTEMTRRRLMAGEGVGLEDENAISKACFVGAKSIAGNKRVQKSIRLAYIAAINHLRRAAYYGATQLTKADTAIQPALLTANILERFEGVLEPEKMVDGAVQLTGQLPVKGIYRGQFPFDGSKPEQKVDVVPLSDRLFVEKNGENNSPLPNSDGVRLRFDINQSGESAIYADRNGGDPISLRDMMRSKKLDELIRDFAALIKRDPIHGEEAVARALYALQVDYDDDCQVLYDKVYEISPMHKRPTDGASINDVSAHFELNTSFATIVPRSELGMQVITIVSVKPLETLSQRPDPEQTEPWTVRNVVHEEMELDEILLKRSDLESDLTAVQEDQAAFWVGYNSHLHHYQSQGPNPQQTAGVEMKSSMWMYDVPTSVTPDNVNYPVGGVDMYPFFNWNGRAAEYTIRQVAAVATSLARGPNPVERVQLFADDPTLINEEL